MGHELKVTLFEFLYNIRLDCYFSFTRLKSGQMKMDTKIQKLVKKGKELLFTIRGIKEESFME